MLDRYMRSLKDSSVKTGKVYDIILDDILFKSLKEFNSDVVSLLQVLLNGKKISWVEYDLLDSYGLVGKRRKRDKHCTPCDIKSEYVMFFCKTKLTDYHKGKFGFMCKWCAQKRAEYIGLGNGFISLDYNDIEDIDTVTDYNYEELAKIMGDSLRSKGSDF